MATTPRKDLAQQLAALILRSNRLLGRCERPLLPRREPAAIPELLRLWQTPVIWDIRLMRELYTPYLSTHSILLCFRQYRSYLIRFGVDTTTWSENRATEFLPLSSPKTLPHWPGTRRVTKADSSLNQSFNPSAAPSPTVKLKIRLVCEGFDRRGSSQAQSAGKFRQCPTFGRWTNQTDK
jgi:hypothetical protein